VHYEPALYEAKPAFYATGTASNSSASSTIIDLKSAPLVYGGGLYNKAREF